MKASNLKAGKTASANSVNSKEVSKETLKAYKEAFKTLGKAAKLESKTYSFQAKSFLHLILPSNVWFRKNLPFKFEKNESVESKVNKFLRSSIANSPFVDKDGNICIVRYLFHETAVYPNGQKVKIGYKYVVKSTFTFSWFLDSIYKTAKSQLVVETDKEIMFKVEDSTITTEEVKIDKAPAKVTKKAPAKKAPAKKAPAKKATK